MRSWNGIRNYFIGQLKESMQTSNEIQNTSRIRNYSPLERLNKSRLNNVAMTQDHSHEFSASIEYFFINFFFIHLRPQFVYKCMFSVQVPEISRLNTENNRINR